MWFCFWLFIVAPIVCRDVVFGHCFIFTFSQQAFDESLDFCYRSRSHEWLKIDWQLPSSLARAIRFEHRPHLPEVTLVLWLTVSYTQVTRAKQASCLLHWSSCSCWLFCFSVLHSNRTVNTIILNIKNVLFPKLLIFFIF